ncbi:acyl-CoA thioesterase [Desulfogranum mediterraneum]|uniref:acyl-CoA thioesterase n=1 Tax=Desulfogranum mediterraneum TaxID=160661 RepID=UPI00040670AD|nr:acyl-CoA thioesterase [Desulfogranum mediterraneum]
MRPKPFVPEFLDDPAYLRDQATGITWHRCQLRTLYADTDRSEVVYHANYLKYFELGRAELMRKANYPYKAIEESGYIYPIIKTELNYYSPLFYDDLMYIHTRPAKMELVKLQFDYLITRADNGEIVCTGFTRHCAVNSKLIPVEIDEQTIRLWNEFPE